MPKFCFREPLELTYCDGENRKSIYGAWASHSAQNKLKDVRVSIINIGIGESTAWVSVGGAEPNWQKNKSPLISMKFWDIVEPRCVNV